MRRRRRVQPDPEFPPLHITPNDAARAFKLLADIDAAGKLNTEGLPPMFVRKLRAFTALGRATVYIQED